MKTKTQFLFFFTVEMEHLSYALKVVEKQIKIRKNYD